MAENKDAVPGSATTLQFLNQHFAVICALFVVVIAAIKVFYAAGFQTQTALSILAVADRAQLLSATVLSALTVVLPYLVIVPQFTKWLMRGNAGASTFIQSVVTACLWSPTLLFVLFSITFPLLGVWVLGLLVVLGMSIAARRKGKHSGQRKTGGFFRPVLEQQKWTFASVSGLLLLIVLGQPWIAREAVTLVGERIEVSRVVGTQGDRTLLLVEPGRKVTWVLTSDVRERELCKDETSWDSSPIMQLLHPSDKGVDCESIPKFVKASTVTY